jgi:hypothetical protein
MAKPIYPSSEWDKEDFVTFFDGFRDASVKINEMSSTPQERGRCRNIVEALQEMEIILINSGNTLRRNEKRRLIELEGICNGNYAGFFIE